MKALMDAAVLYGKEDVRISKVQIPTIGEHDALVRVKTALTCGTDLKVYKRGYHSKMITPPAVFGHEFSGLIEEVGPKVSTFKPGMRVVAANSAPCDECYFCIRGQRNLCSDLMFINGAYAQFILIPKRVVHKNLLIIPEHISFKAAALTEPLACAIKAAEESHIMPQDIVLVLGAGPMSLMFVQLAKLMGANVWVTEISEEKLALAKKLGADKTIPINTLKDPVKNIRDMTNQQRGPDIVIDATGNPSCWEQATQIVRKGGVINFFGGCPSGTHICLDTELLHYSQLKLLASFHHTPYYIRKSLDLIASGKISTDLMIQQEKPLSLLPEILSSMTSDKKPYTPKTAIIP